VVKAAVVVVAAGDMTATRVAAGTDASDTIGAENIFVAAVLPALGVLRSFTGTVAFMNTGVRG
jgi:multisubunit Na+/H+ antiporter MnhF subunit